MELYNNRGLAHAGGNMTGEDAKQMAIRKGTIPAPDEETQLEKELKKGLAELLLYLNEH